MSEAGVSKKGGRPKVFKLVPASLVLFVMPALQFRTCVLCLLADTWHFHYLLACILLAPALGIISIFSIRKSKGLALKVIIIYVAVLGLVTSGYLVAARSFTHEDCEQNLRIISHAMWAYAGDNDGKFPTADKWCSLLVQHTDLESGRFVCKSAKRGMSNYAINPNAALTSPRNMVLLFETKGGWNQAGGPKLLTLDNHGGAGCNVIFINGYVGFVEARWVGALKWKIEDYRKNRPRSGLE